MRVLPVEFTNVLAALKLGQDLDDDLYASFDAGIQI